MLNYTTKLTLIICIYYIFLKLFKISTSKSKNINKITDYKIIFIIIKVAQQ